MKDIECSIGVDARMCIRVRARSISLSLSLSHRAHERRADGRTREREREREKRSKRATILKCRSLARELNSRLIHNLLSKATVTVTITSTASNMTRTNHWFLFTSPRLFSLVAGVTRSHLNN
jgi:hypothetical protein